MRTTWLDQSFKCYVEYYTQYFFLSQFIVDVLSMVSDVASYQFKVCDLCLTFLRIYRRHGTLIFTLLKFIFFGTLNLSADWITPNLDIKNLNLEISQNVNNPDFMWSATVNLDVILFVKDAISFKIVNIRTRPTF